MKRFFCFSVFVFAGLAAELQAQSVVTTGAVRGVARDSSGASVAGARVVLLARGTGESSMRATNGAGIFVFPSQPVGTYGLEVTAAGFRKEVIEGVSVTVGQPTTVNVRLQPGAGPSRSPSAASLLCCGRKTPIRVGDRPRVAQRLPFNGRRFLDFALLVPNASPDGQKGLVSFAGEQGGEDTGYANANGANSFTVDGASATSNYFGALVAGARPLHFWRERHRGISSGSLTLPRRLRRRRYRLRQCDNPVRL